ncbi:MAG TPA: hypothetical protein VF077_13250 [Nitrospiraceae bacterium]
MAQELTADDLQHLLHVPEVSLHSGVLCIGLLDGSVIRITGYIEWIRMEHYTANEREQADPRFIDI